MYYQQTYQDTNNNPCRIKLSGFNILYATFHLSMESGKMENGHIQNIHTKNICVCSNVVKMSAIIDPVTRYWCCARLILKSTSLDEKLTVTSFSLCNISWFSYIICFMGKVALLHASNIVLDFLSYNYGHYKLGTIYLPFFKIWKCHSWLDV